ncbi:MAG: hypothetical protein ABW003_25040 [Microvirga sp.]
MGLISRRLDYVILGGKRLDGPLSVQFHQGPDGRISVDVEWPMAG